MFKKYKVWLSAPHLNGSELDYIRDAFANNWVSPYGDNIEAFESQLEEYFDVPDVALVNSGTAAIHLALVLSGVEQGDEVIVPTLNFAGCVNPILYQKATPLFADSEYDTYNVDPNIVEDILRQKEKSGKKPKAIIAVDLFGIPAQLKQFEYLSDKYGVPLIEDAADAIGSTYNGTPLGRFGKAGIISFNGNKVITTSGGGALISTDATLIAKAKYLSNQARKITPYYQHDAVGYNYMMSNILAGIGRGQFSSLQERVARRRRIFDTYKTELKNTGIIEFKKDVPGAASNRWLSVGLINNTNDNAKVRDELFYQLADKGIESRPVWKPMHQQPAFDRYPYFGGKVAGDLFQRGLCLPSGSNMTDEELHWVITVMKDILYDQAGASKSFHKAV
jgi:dTDP-4-amino-4,6-dideoxygalactose transaminase